MNFATYSRNFRGSPDGWVDIAGTNFLVGENSTGKSSYLKLFKIVLSSDFQLRNLVYLRDRPDFNFDDFYSKLSTDASSETKSFDVGCFGYRSDLGMNVGRICTFINKSGTPKMSKLSFAIGSKNYRFVNDRKSIAIYESKGRQGMSHRGLQQRLAKFHRCSTDELGEPSQSEPIPDNISKDDDQQDLVSLKLEMKNPTGSSLPFVPDLVANVDHLGPIRARPGRVYQVGGDVKSIQGERSLDKLAKEDVKTLEECNSFGRESGLFDRMEVKTIEELGPNNLVITFEKNGRQFFAEELGFGVGQIVPVLVEATRQRGSAVLIAEQPELHLHPRAQAAFGKLIATFSRKGHTSIIETHSDYLLDRYRIERAKRKTDGITAQVMFFSSRGNRNYVRTIQISQSGELIDPPKKYRSFFLKETLSKLSVL